MKRGATMNYWHRLQLRFALSVLLAAAPLLSRAQVDHSPKWSSATNLTYGLVDLDGFSPGGYAYCRWGTLQDTDSFGSVTLAFRWLTAPPFNNNNTDLFITTDGFLQRVTWNGSVRASSGQIFPSTAIWTPPVGKNSGQIAISNEGDLDLYRYLHFQNQLMERVSGTVLPATARKLVILIHGYNPDSLSDQITTSSTLEFSSLATALSSALGNTDWGLVHYHWETDSDTGPLGVLTPFVNPTAAAEISNLHGQHLGELLAKGFPNLEKAQVIAHSAGAWAARSTARYILKNLPNCAVQVTLLDPFMPTALFPSPNTVLGDAVMDVFDSVEGNQQLKTLENYFANEVSNPLVFSFGTQETFAWDRLSDRNIQVDGTFGSQSYSSHAGPVQFYADTVNATLQGHTPSANLIPFDIRPTSALRIGWTRSLFYNEPLILQTPQSRSAFAGENIIFTTTANSRDGVLNAVQDTSLTYQWRRNGTILQSATSASLQINSVQMANAGTYTVTVSNSAGSSTSSTAILTVNPATPEIATQPTSQAITAGGSVTLAVGATGASPLSYQWLRNGTTVSGGTNAALLIGSVQPANTGLYSAVVTNSVAATTSQLSILGVSTTSKVIGAAEELLPHDIPHPNGNIFDQVLLEGAAATITADYSLNQITRMSFIDLTDDIVQVEFGGPGTLSLVLDNPTGPATPVNYTQPTVTYMRGHAGIVITGANENTNVSVFTVGRATAFDPTGTYNILLPIGATNNPANNGSSLFQGHATTAYDGIADIAFIAISSTNGKFGGVRTSNANYFASRGVTGVYAPGVAFQGPLFIGDISASDAATPMIVIGSSGDTRITGGDLLQANGQPVKVAGLTQLKFTAGGDSKGTTLSAKTNRAILQQDGVDVTSQVVVNPSQ